MNLSPPTNLLNICYDSLDKLIKNVQLHTNIQGYAVCRFCTKKLSSTRLLKIYYLYCN